MLGKVISELQRDWGTKILGVMAAYRATVHEAKSYSTNIQMFGRELRAPIDLVHGDQRKSSTPTWTRLWRRFASPKREAYALARDILGRRAERNKHSYDMRSRPTKFEVGDWV